MEEENFSREKEKEIRELISSLDEPVKVGPFSKDLDKRMENLRLVFKKLNLIFQDNPFAALNNAFEFLKRESPTAFLELSKHGWYLDFSTEPKTPIDLSHLVKNGKIAEVDRYLMEDYLSRIGEIERKLIKNHPTRKEIIAEAFECFDKRMFSSSITLFLTQVDGICYDKAQKFYFRNSRKSKGKHIPEIQELLETEIDDFFKVFLSPIFNTTAINDHSSKLAQYFSPLNRHLVLHGMDTNYGSKINCLKIISLLNYLDDVLSRF